VPPDADGLRIVVVDDDPAFARVVAAVLESAGFRGTRIAGTCQEGLQAAVHADIVLLDHQLPDGTGVGLLPALRALPGQPAVILVTAHGDETLAAGALRAGAHDYLSKDATLPELLPEIVERARRNRALREALAAAERDLVHAERLAAIGQLAVTVSHNVNNPLMAAFAETTLLLADPQLGSQHRSSVTSIREALQRINDTLQRVSSLRHAETTTYPGGLEMIDLTRRKRPTPVNTGDAVIWLGDESLARVVRSLLTHAGFSVDRVQSLAELERRTAAGPVTAVVLMSSGLASSPPLGGFQPAAGRRYALVALVPGDGAAERAAGADLVVSLPFDPGTFTGDLLAVLHG
jgi:DNA-binding response OmpR family regulator